MRIQQLVDDQAAELDRQSQNAARRNKPTMWAYYGDMARWLRSLEATDQGDLVAMLRSCAVVESDDFMVTPARAARLWAQGVYARRILAAAGIRVARPSLAWLRERAA